MSLIGLLSVGVISLVVWLVLVFLSVTNGIEKNWLKKLTAISAPIRITPTDAYYASYYYQVDGISGQSDYTYKNIGEKRDARSTDPYLPEWDQDIPRQWPQKVCNPDGSTKDLVKETFNVLNALNLKAQDYETSGAILNLRMHRFQPPFSPTARPKEERHLVQLFYLSTFNETNPNLTSLIEPPTVEDLNHLFFASPTLLLQPKHPSIEGDLQRFRDYLKRFLSHISIQKIRTTSSRWDSLFRLIPEEVAFEADGIWEKGRLCQIALPLEKKSRLGKVIKKAGVFYFIEKNGTVHPIEDSTSFLIEDRIEMEATLSPPLFEHIQSLKDIFFTVKVPFQGYLLEGEIYWEGVQIQKATAHMHFDQPPKIAPLWPYFVRNVGTLPKGDAFPVILPKCLQNSGVLIGDPGYFSYGRGTPPSIQEHSLPITVCGFYDPGVLPIGGKIVLTGPELPHTINQTYEAFSDPFIQNGIQVYLDDLKGTKKAKTTIERALEEKGLAPYWNVTTFEEYEAVRDLLKQFQSDRYLFTLIGGIVLLVACSNILSFLILLVNDKRKEIAVLSAMGTSKKRIALIFTLCGGIVGTLSSLIGMGCATLTLRYIDQVVHVLSLLQGRDAFNALFYGKSLPNQLSHHALIFILIATPILSLLAGLLPALKAAKLHPSEILRGE